VDADHNLDAAGNLLMAYQITFFHQCFDMLAHGIDVDAERLAPRLECSEDIG